ncbi:MAG: ATP-dependent 6-phosphofructokinase [Candidatus Marinimicrobia bacterium]|nr:ATP-dependent 6-phosphofructokinase [Candidatus Neomarinimicrobiota bacterium]
MSKYIGVLTAGGDSPGLNAAIRGLGKAGEQQYDMHLIGFQDGFRGLMENRFIRLNNMYLSGILTIGGTILGTSRDKPHKMQVGDRTMDMTDVMLEVYNKHHFDALVCIGGGGTQKNAYHLYKHGMNIITLPKTIDNDIFGTDRSFGYDSALQIATDAVDRLHSTAHSHHRIIVAEIMGHNAGWLALGAGVAGGADVILIPEIPYEIESIAEAIRSRRKKGKHFSIVAIAEGALSKQDAKILKKVRSEIENASNQDERRKAKKSIVKLEKTFSNNTIELSRQLEILTGLISRVTILGHVQRGGAPSPADRLLATQLGSACAKAIQNEEYGVMIAMKNDLPTSVPLKDIVGKRKTVPLDHPLIESARMVGTNFGD